MEAQNYMNRSSGQSFSIGGLIKNKCNSWFSIGVGDEVFVMENQITMSYKKTSIKKINLDTYKVEVHDRDEPISYYPDYTQVRGYNIQLYGPYETQTTTLTKN